MMKSLSLLFVVIFVGIVTTNGLQMKPLSRSRVYNPASSSPSILMNSSSFEFYLLVLQWNPQVTTSYFTIHGMWPENYDGSYPQNCKGPSFNTSAISDLLPTLQSVWPSNKGDNNVFWQHEWEKHGTCSEFGEHDYFQNAAKLQSQFDVKSALSDASIFPTQGKKFSTTDIKAAVRQKYANPALKCNGNALAEIALCFSKSLKVTSCPNDLGSYFNCPDNVTYD